MQSPTSFVVASSSKKRVRVETETPKVKTEETMLDTLYKEQVELEEYITSLRAKKFEAKTKMASIDAQIRVAEKNATAAKLTKEELSTTFYFRFGDSNPTCPVGDFKTEFCTAEIDVQASCPMRINSEGCFDFYVGYASFDEVFNTTFSDEVRTQDGDNNVVDISDDRAKTFLAKAESIECSDALETWLKEYEISTELFDLLEGDGEDKTNSVTTRSFRGKITITVYAPVVEG